jgi:cysteine desulfurase
VNAAAPIYLDYAATTPVDAAVAAVMSECLTLAGSFGNPSSAHAFGRAAAQRVADARAQVAALIGASPEEIVFTSGATESNNLAILGVAAATADRGRHLITMRTEHKAVLDPCRHLERAGASVTYLSPDATGRITVAQLERALRADTVLVSLMYANNETGVLQDLPSLASLCRARGVAFHSDCAQAAPRVALDVRALPVDLLSFTAHKLYGPKGIGALYLRGGARGLLQPILFGGGQERGLRPGTLPVHQIAGFGAACELIRERRASEPARLEALTRRLWEGLEPLGELHLNGGGAPRVPGILNVSFAGVEGESLIGGLGGLAVSAGAACNSESREPSYVLRALGRDARLAEASLRFSLGRFSTEDDLDAAVLLVSQAVVRLRGLSPRAPAPDGGPAWDAPGSRRVSGEAGTDAAGTWVRFHLLVADDCVKDARFQAFACPHTTDTAAWLCQRLRGARRSDLGAGTPAEWAQARSVPVEKLGRLLVVEDALNDCITRWT